LDEATDSNKDAHFIAYVRFWDATRGLLATDHVILSHGQVTWTTPELELPLLTTTPQQREDISALDRFNMQRCHTRGSQKVEVCTVAGGSGRPRNTNDREDRAIRSGHFGTNNVASIDSTPLTSFRHPVPSRETIRETTDRSWLEEPTSAKTLTTDPHHRQCRLDFADLGSLGVTDWRRVIFSDESRFSLSADDHHTCLEAHQPAVDPAFIVRRHTAISQEV
ncbi:HTH_Tnp_Tc3_2 domain-containing protein, partial [Trichonephila clavipes]